MGARRCTQSSDTQTLLRSHGYAAMATGRGGVHVLAGPTRTLDGPALSLWKLNAAALLPTPRAVPLPVAVRTGNLRPGLVLHDKQPAIALVDAGGNLFVKIGGADRWSRLAQRADTRFAPSMDSVANTVLVAWTHASTPMSVRLARLIPGHPPDVRDVTPTGYGASAPSFVHGASPPRLLMLDAHAGMSPILELPFDARGRPGEVHVRASVGRPAEPSTMAGVQTGSGVQVAYTAVGKFATSAVGVVTLTRSDPPRALLSGLGYGALHVSGEPHGDQALFALDAPTSHLPDATRAVQLHHADARNTALLLALGPAHVGPREPRLARLPGSGTFALLHRTGTALQLRWIGCDGQTSAPPGTTPESPRTDP